jgi:hypothetical protein
MTDNPDYGTKLFALLAKADSGDGAPLAAYLAADSRRAATADRSYVLLVRSQFGTDRDGRWYSYSAQPDRNPWPGTSARTALVLIRRDTSGRLSWHEFTLPQGMSIDAISAMGSTFRMRAGGVEVTTTGDGLFRVIADGAFGLPGFSEAEIVRGFDKLAGRAPLDVVGPAESGAILGSALPLVLEDPVLGTFTFKPERPAHYFDTSEYGPSYSLFADPAGDFAPALARAREVIPGMDGYVTEGARLVQAIKPNFGKADAPRLAGAAFRPDGIVEITIDDDDRGSVSAELQLGPDEELRLVGFDDN